MLKKLIAGLVMATCLTGVNADTRPPIIMDLLVQKPVTALDFFLSNFYYQAGGYSYFEKGVGSPHYTARLISIYYTNSSETIKASFQFHSGYEFKIGDSYQNIESISQQPNAAERKKFMIAAAIDLSKILGLEPRDIGFRQGVIQASLPRTLTREDRDSMGDLIAERMELTVNYLNSNRGSYTVTRTTNGQYIYSERIYPN